MQKVSLHRGGIKGQTAAREMLLILKLILQHFACLDKKYI